MKLHGSYTSPYVRHCRIALMHSGLTWEFVETDYYASAEGSPTKRVPFLADNGSIFTDSTSILSYIAEKSGGRFLHDSNDVELYCMANTVLDAARDLFLLEREDITPSGSEYLTRQSDRIQTGLDELGELISSSQSSEMTGGRLRLACFLDWALFRNRITLDSSSALKAFLDESQSYPHFKETAPAE